MSDSGNSRVPKGILKNKASRFSSAGEGSDVSMDGHHGRQPLNYHGQVSTTSWESDKGQSDLGGLSNEPKPMDSGLGLDRNGTIRLKLGEFISRKADMIFKPLGTDDMPVNDGKGLQRNTEDHYGIVPSLDHFLRVDASDLRRYFFQNVQPGDIVIACIVSKSTSGLFLKLLCTDGGKHLVLEDLGIKAFCPSGQMVPAIDPRDPNRVYTAGDLVRCEIIEVPSDSDKLVAGMKGVSLPPEMQHSSLLGLISHYDLPRQFSLAKSESESRSRRTYEDLLVTTSGFQNPNNINHLASSMGIMSNKNTLMSGLRGSFPNREIATQLRKVQNGRWAHGNVAEGIRYFKLGKYTEAFQSLNKALSIDAENVEGLVARGALYANNGSYEKAVEDFEVALKFNPSHFNARKYLAETLVAYGKQLDENGKLEDAVASFSKCLVIRPDHRDARDALLSLHTKVEKIDHSKLSGVAATKAMELKEKLKAILQSELGFKVDDKNKSKKKKKRMDSSGSVDASSSSSSSDSDSDSSSSDSDSYKGKKKKKSRKKKSKKSKRSKKGIDFKRDLSLSPFSKRLVDPGAGGIPSGSGLAGFGESSIAEWGKQLGIGKPDRPDSEEDSKRSKKKDKKRSKKSKEKRKKKKQASSDNESSSSDSDSSRTKEKRKSKKLAENQSIEGIIPDLGDLEAKLSAYYSKVEQGKIESMITPQSVKVTVEQNLDKRHNPNAYENPVRKIEVIPKEESITYRDATHATDVPNCKCNCINRQEVHTTHSNAAWNDKERIDLRTDDYGNYTKSENIVRTVINDQPEQKLKFEMKIRGAGNPAQGLAPSALSLTSEENTQSELGSKWRKVGAPTAVSSYTVTRPDGSAVVKTIDTGLESKSGETSSGIPKHAVDRSLTNPLAEDKKPEVKRKEQERNYRGKRDSRSRSRSPYRKGRRSSRSRSYSSRSRSRSRGRSRSRSRSYSRSRSRSYSRSPRRSYSYRGNYRGRGSTTRFFRGYNRPMRRPFIPRGNYRGGNDYRVNSNRSRFRNRFSHSPSRSRSRSRPRYSRSKSRSRSPHRDRDHGRRRSSVDKKNPSSGSKEVVDITKSPEKVSSGGSSKNAEKTGGVDVNEKGKVNADSEIQIGTLKTTSAADVEELLDKRNAEKKEEMRKSNPDFFRNA